MNETCNDTWVGYDYDCSEYANNCSAYFYINECYDHYENCSVAFENPYDGSMVYDWTCEEFEATFVNDTDDEDECNYFQHDFTCDDFSFTDDTCDVYVEYSDCSEETGFFICDVAGIDSTGAEYAEDCTTDFYDPQFWAMMREEEFWSVTEDDVEDFYNFWEEYHSNNEECVYCQYHNCTSYVEDMGYCNVSSCYDSCTEMEMCDVTFYMDYMGSEQTWSCDSFEEYFINDDNSTNHTCEDVYIDLTCGNFTMLAD